MIDKTFQTDKNRFASGDIGALVQNGIKQIPNSEVGEPQVLKPQNIGVQLNVTTYVINGKIDGEPFKTSIRYDADADQFHSDTTVVVNGGNNETEIYNTIVRTLGLKGKEFK